MKIMYIAILDEVPDHIAPTLVAHSVLNAHEEFRRGRIGGDQGYFIYDDWFENSFKKVTVRVNRKEFEKIRTTMPCWEGHENKTLRGATSCLVVLPVDGDNKPNVLKFAKMWSPIAA